MTKKSGQDFWSYIPIAITSARPPEIFAGGRADVICYMDVLFPIKDNIVFDSEGNQCFPNIFEKMDCGSSGLIWTLSWLSSLPKKRICERKTKAITWSNSRMA